MGSRRSECRGFDWQTTFRRYFPKRSKKLFHRNEVNIHKHRLLRLTDLLGCFTRMTKKLFIALCIAAPVAFALVRPIFVHSVSVAAAFAITGLVLAVVLLGWSIWKLSSDRRHVGFGFLSVFVCFCFSVVVADYFAAHEARQRQSAGTNFPQFSR